MESRRPVDARSGAIPIALSTMLGAGIFVGLSPAAGAAGFWLLSGIPLAALVALCCAAAVAAQSSNYQDPGSGYACVRDEFGVIPARIGAATHWVGHIAAMAAVAGTAGDYLAPNQSPAVATAAVLLIVLAATAGWRVRGPGAWAWCGLTFVLLTLVTAVSFAISPAQAAALATRHSDGAVGIPGAAGLLFFAYLGFERLFARGSESDREAPSLPRSLPVVLAVVTGTLLMTGSALLYQLGPARLALSPVPFLDVLTAADAGGLRSGIAVGIAISLLPVLLGVLESARSTPLAWAADGDLPAALCRTGPHRTPVSLDLTAALLAAGLAWLIDPAAAIALAVCCLLVYYTFVQASARVMLGDERCWWMRAACVGMGLAVLLAMSMPLSAMLGVLGTMIAGPVLAGLISRRWH